MANYLIESGFSVDVKNEDGYSPLAIAVSNNNREITTILLKAGATCRSSFYPNMLGPLHIAVKKNNFFMVSLLLNHGLKYDSSSAEKNPLFLAFEKKAG